MSTKLVLVSHALCPYVQRAAIVLAEKNVDFERRNIDLANKPDWFLKASPLGKTPVLLVGDQAIFESAVICEYLDDTESPRLHPEDSLSRARHRSWIEFGSAVLNTIGAFYSAETELVFTTKAAQLKGQFEQVELALSEGPYFMGDRFSIVDAVFGPIFRYFDVFDAIDDFGVFAETPKVRAWRKHLASRKSVEKAVGENYSELLRDFLRRKKSALSERMINPAATENC